MRRARRSPARSATAPGCVVPLRVGHLPLHTHHAKGEIAEAFKPTTNGKRTFFVHNIGGVIQSAMGFGTREGERLGHHFADDDVEVGEDGDGDDAREGVRDQERRTSGSTEEVIDAVGENVLAVPYPGRGSLP